MNDLIPLLSLHYFPSLEYFVVLSQYKIIKIEAFEFYEKQSYRNRCYILGSNKIQNLTIPVNKENPKELIKEIKIDYSQKWLNVHWRSINSAYGKSPFFLYYGDFLKEILFKNHKFLFDLNLELLTKILEILGLKPEIIFTTEYNKSEDGQTLDLRQAINPKNSYQMNNLYSPCRYNQIFGNEFVTNLSILDLLLCEGSEALTILRKSAGSKFNSNEENNIR